MLDFKKAEDEALKLWKSKKIYDKSKRKNLKGKKFYFMDGPPYATGHIHMGTALNKILKDIAMRSKRLQGFDVFDRPGYDTHGIPIEFQVEKEIGSKSKKDIEKYGVKKFINKCKNYATKYIDVMNNEFENLGVWMDFKNPYLTLDDKYIESIWDTFKVADKKKLLYLGKYPVHICPRCETAVAFNEIEYGKQEDNSVFVKFPLKDKKSFLIIWTTTPWTLPGNTGIMVNPNFDYQEIEVDDERWILAKELIPKIMGNINKDYTIKSSFKGIKMKDWKYGNPLIKNLKLSTKPEYKVVLSSRYVNLDEGTGLVHCAPGHGKEDYEVGNENNLNILSPVGINGLMNEECGKYEGGKAREVDKVIIEDLEKGNYLVHQMKYSHDYPLCWRCKSSLLMILLPQWFLKISEIHSKILKENGKTNWIPNYMGLRMKAWLEGISDWPVSRKRYWGTPLPIWICESCNDKIVVGSLNELRKLGGKVNGIHKPEIDEVVLKCKCNGKMKRVEEVLDVWFDSGVSSWAILDEKNFKKFWPADLNLEGKDQFRGWWNSQMILSQIKFEKKPFDSILVHGMVLDLGKRKMSKSKGNIIAPKEIIDKYGRDFLRYYFAKISKGEDFAFDEKEFKDIRKFFTFLINVGNFINQLKGKKSNKTIEDKWILSRLNHTIKKVYNSYNEYRFDEIVQSLESFLIDDLSKNYIKMIRSRADETYDVLKECMVSFLKMLAPICPLITESIWQEIKNKKVVREESIHLSEWPTTSSKINNRLEREFDLALVVIEKGLSERDKAQIGLKWPLGKAVIVSNEKINKELVEIIKEQLNVKGINNILGEKMSVKLDTKITPELEAEGYAREICRKVQAARKKEGLVKSDWIDLEIEIEADLGEQLDFIKERTNSKSLKIGLENRGDKIPPIIEDKIKGKRLIFFFKKI